MLLERKPYGLFLVVPYDDAAEIARQRQERLQHLAQLAFKPGSQSSSQLNRQTSPNPSIPTATTQPIQSIENGEATAQPQATNN